jgi:hypothetical protein
MYYYYKSIIFEFENNESFNKIIISDNKIIKCENSSIKKNIHEKINNFPKNINYVEFYVSLYDYEIIKEDIYWNTIKNLDLVNLPIYKKDTDLYEYLEWLNKNFNNNNVRTYETSKFTKRQTIFDNNNDDNKKCLESVVYKNTNKKFNNFNQIFFHAGDPDDIERFGYLYIRTLYQKEKIFELPKNNVFLHDDKFKIWDKFIPDFESIKNTMFYMFNQMKKGILVGIKNNKLAIFLPFSNHSYTNDFYTELYFDDQDKKNLLAHKKNPNDSGIKKKLENTLKYYLNKYKLNSKNIILDRKKWVANDCFFRYENYEGDKSEALYEDFLTELCANRDLPDCIFFLNLRDHPMLNKNLKNSYTSIIDKELDELYIHDKYAPILSPGGSNKTADICMCTQDDWARVSKKIYPDDCKNGYLKDVKMVDWDKKINKAIFRGSATGCGTNEETNPRIKATILSNKYPEYLDAGITTFNRKLKKNLHEPLKIIDIKLPKANFMTLEEKAQYKYILNLDGHVSAFRLGHELSFCSVVLIQKSKYYLWFSHLLEPYVHYVPVTEDLSDLIEKIKWCIDNDSKCMQIATNALQFYKKYLEKDGVFDYMQKLLNTISLKSLGLKKYKEKIAIITIYRNKENNARLYQKRLYLYLMNKMLSQICDYDIILVEQSEKYLFNIGKLKNIGFDYLCKNSNTNYSNYIFSDIDTIPDTNLIDYIFKPTNSLNSLAVKGTRYEHLDTKISRPFVGALISCTKNVFEELNGFPNNFYGWQGEDENLLIRLHAINKPLYIPQTGKIIDIEETNGYKKTLNTKLEELKNEREKKTWEKNMNWKNFKQNGLTNLNYTVLYENKFKFNDQFNNYHIIVDLEQDKDMKKFPNDYVFENFTVEKDEYKNLMKNTIYKIKQINL